MFGILPERNKSGGQRVGVHLLPSQFLAIGDARFLTQEFLGNAIKRGFEDVEGFNQPIQTIPDELAILPVRNAVISLFAVLSLTVEHESLVKLINDVQQQDGILVVLNQEDRRVDSPEA
jgi:hypothetical protein